MIYQLKTFLLQPYMRWQRKKHSHNGPVGIKILEVNQYSSAIKRWFRDNAKTRLLLQHELGPDSIVYDVGGYIGEWTQGISERYDAHIEVFEAVPNFVRKLEEKFADNPKITVHPYGLLNRNTTETFYLKGPGSTSDAGSDDADLREVKADLRDFAKVCEQLGHDNVDLLKINIEGGEYPLLQRLLNQHLAQRFDVIMVQYHEWIPGAYWSRMKINRRLSRTHRRVWNYPFVWEKWQRKN